MTPKLSIITVNFNNNSGLKDTIASIEKQSFLSYEHIIIDAGSTDGSRETITRYATNNPHVTYWVSEHDNGIYDGMNKGIDHANGEYLYFLNSGDALMEHVLDKIPFDGTQYIYGDVWVCETKEHAFGIQYPFPIDHVAILVRDTICHQVCFIHHSLFKNQRYRTDCVIVSDWIFLVDHLIFKGCSYKHIPMYIANYDANGISSACGTLGMDERLNWLNGKIPQLLYDSMVELDEKRKELRELKDSELGRIIPTIAHTRKFAKRARRLIMFLYKINSLLSFHRPR